MLYTQIGPLTQVLALDSGFELVVLNAVSATGTAGSQYFTVPGSDPQGSALTLTAIPNGAVSALTVDLEVSADGGVTFQKKHVGIALITASVSTQAVESNLQAGLIYRLNITTITGGTNVTVVASAN